MRYAMVFVVNCALAAILLVVFELVFGNWVRPLGVRDLRRFSIPVNVQYEMEALYSRERGAQIKYSRDKWGLRGNYGQLSDIDVLTIGGSTTDQRYLDDSETWQAYAEHRLKQRGIQLVFANAGVDGQSTIGHLFSFRYWFPVLQELHPKIVLFYLGINDVLQPADRGDFDAKVDATSWRVRSVTWQMLKTIRGNLLARQVHATHGVKPELSEYDFTSVGRLRRERQLALAQELGDRFVANVARLREHVVVMGAIPIFVTQTAYAWNSGAGTPRGVDRTIMSSGEEMNFADVSVVHQIMNERLLDYCASENLTCFDLATEVRFEDNDFYDFLHTTPTGAERIGTYIADKLVENSMSLRVQSSR
jgi:lysophospholipase L1-like esterase